MIGGGGKPDPTINEIMDTLELFVGSFDKFIGVFDAEYTGGDFCAGLTFGNPKWRVFLP